MTESLDLGAVFPDIGVRQGALWSMLYLAGYLTTEDIRRPNSRRERRRLRIPNKEVAELFADEVVERFSTMAGGNDRLESLHKALVAANTDEFETELSHIARDSATL